MTKLLNLSKPITTRDGRPVRILTQTLNNNSNIVAIVTEADGLEDVWCFMSDGRFQSDKEHELDLINPVVKKKGWINIYSSKRYPNRTSETIYPTKKRADEGVSITEERVDCIEIEWEE